MAMIVPHRQDWMVYLKIGLCLNLGQNLAFSLTVTAFTLAWLTGHMPVGLLPRGSRRRSLC
jgi:hypothetical protein